VRETLYREGVVFDALGRIDQLAAAERVPKHVSRLLLDDVNDRG
jgi:hypothetical protein